MPKKCARSYHCGRFSPCLRCRARRHRYIETKNPGGGLTDGIPFHLAVVGGTVALMVDRPLASFKRLSDGSLAWDGQRTAYECSHQARQRG